MAWFKRHDIGFIALSLVFSAACASPLNDAPASVQRILAPTGALRVGVYAGSPSSIIPGDSPANARGVGHDLGKALAARLGVPFNAVVFSSNALVLAAVKAGTVDVTFVNATEERAQDMDFTSTYMDVEKSFLVPADSPLTSLADIKSADIRVGVSAGSTSAEELRPLYAHAQLIKVPTLADAKKMLARHELDAFATNDAILFEMSDKLAGSHVLSGHWGLEHFAAAIPKGRDAAISYLNAFIGEAVADGTVKAAINRAHLRGALSRPEN